MILDSEGHPASSITISPEGTWSAGTATIPAVVVSAPRKELVPGPGQVLVLRNTVETAVNGIEKPLSVVEAEEIFNIKAVVARIGEDKDGKAWFAVGDEVVIAPHAFTEVELGRGDSIWLGPFIGVKAKFVEAE